MSRIYISLRDKMHKVAENENNNTDFFSNRNLEDLLEKCYRTISNINPLYKSFRSIFQTKDTYKRTMREILRFSKKEIKSAKAIIHSVFHEK